MRVVVQNKTYVLSSLAVLWYKGDSVQSARLFNFQDRTEGWVRVVRLSVFGISPNRL
jgi:hypothetical protein